MFFVWHVYNVRGVDQVSGKKSKLKIIARDEAAAEKEAANRGLMPPYTFAEIDFDEPTDRQISYAEDLGIKIMAGMNRKDISALIDKHNDNDTTPTDGLMSFAYEHNIYFSPYIGERALCILLFNELPAVDKTAFFCYAVHQSMAGERLDNLDASTVRDVCYQFADIYSINDSYQRSLDEYSGGDLVVFGEAQGGGSKRKKAYQDAKTFLDAFLPAEVILPSNTPTETETDEVITPKFTSPDAEIPDDGFIVIGGQVAMPEETVAALLGVTIDKLHELSRSVDMDNREGGIYVRDGKQYFASPQVIFKVRDANGKKSADLSNRKLFAVFDKAEARLTPKEHKAKNRRLMFKVGAVILAVVAYANFSEPSKPSQTPPPSKVEQSALAPVTETKSAFDTAPARISTLPSIGATRAEFDTSYTATNKNGVGYIRYNQDVWHAQFLNANWDDSDDKNARAYMVMVQVLPGLPLSMTGIEDLIPADAENVQYDSSGSDKVVTVRNFTGTSEQIKAIFPHSNGKFGGGFNWDAATGKFIGGTIMVEYPFPPSKK